MQLLILLFRAHISLEYLPLLEALCQTELEDDSKYHICLILY